MNASEMNFIFLLIVAFNLECCQRLADLERSTTHVEVKQYECNKNHLITRSFRGNFKGFIGQFHRFHFVPKQLSLVSKGLFAI